MSDSRTPSPVSATAETPPAQCSDCGAKLDEGTASADAELVADHVLRFWQPVPESYDVAQAARRILVAAGREIPDSPLARVLARSSPSEAAPSSDDARDAEIARLRARIEELEKPDICGFSDYVYYEQDGFDGAAEVPNRAVKLDWANRVLYGDWHAVNVVTAWDDEGDPHDTEVRLFRSRAEADAAIAESMASRPASPPLSEALPNGE